MRASRRATQSNAMPSKSQCLRPRLCTLEKGDNGYGFHLHGEKGKTGQFIRLVEPDSPAESSGLRAGDRLVFVNGEDVENESHQQVVSRIRATLGRLELVVVDPDTEQLLKKHQLKCLPEYVHEGIPLAFEEEEDEEVEVEVEVTVEEEELVAEEEAVELEEEGEEEEEEEKQVVVAAQEEEEEEEERGEDEVDGTENGDEVLVGQDGLEDEVVEEEVVVEVQEEVQAEQQVLEDEEDKEEEEAPRESTPILESNGEIHDHVEKKLSVTAEQVSPGSSPQSHTLEEGRV